MGVKPELGYMRDRSEIKKPVCGEEKTGKFQIQFKLPSIFQNIKSYLVLNREHQ